MRNVTGAVAERNEANPRFTPDGTRLSFERREGQAQSIWVVDLARSGDAGERVTSAAKKAAASAEEALLGAAPADDSYNAQLSFFPDSRRFVFTGNGGGGTYRIYQGGLGEAASAFPSASKEDGHPAVSPDGKWIAYISARSGIGKLILREAATGVERSLTGGGQVDLYPAWSPDSKSLAYTSGDNDNHDVYVIPDVAAAPPVVVPLTTWKFDDLRPTFSADGTLVAFYSNFSPSGDEREWSILAVPAKGGGPTKGEALGKLVVATNVAKDPEVGPAWKAQGHAIVYAKNLKAEFNPIYAADLDTHQETRIETGTKMNHDLAVARDGTLAFRAQVATWDDVFVATPKAPAAKKP